MKIIENYINPFLNILLLSYIFSLWGGRVFRFDKATVIVWLLITLKHIAKRPEAIMHAIKWPIRVHLGRLASLDWIMACWSNHSTENNILQTWDTGQIINRSVICTRAHTQTHACTQTHIHVKDCLCVRIKVAL